MKQLVFERINSGGVQLSNQEGRNALLPGRMNDLCITLSADENFRRCWGFPSLEECLQYEPSISSAEKDDPDSDEPEEPKVRKGEEIGREKVMDAIRRMDDVEYVLRFFAMRQRGQFPALPLRDYLSLYMRKANELSPEVFVKLEDMFRSTFRLVAAVLGDNAFRRWLGKNWAARRSTLAYDAIVQSFCTMIPWEETLVNRKVDVEVALKKAYLDNKDRFSASYATYHYHAQRVQWVTGSLMSVIGDPEAQPKV